MKRKNGKEEVRRFAAGDLVSDGQFTGLVVGGFIDPADGVGMYTVMVVDGGMIPMRSYEIKAGISREETARALDLRGIDPLNSERSLMAYSGVSPCIKREQITDAGDARAYLLHLSDLVQRNAAPNSRVFKAFAVYEEQRERDEEPTWACGNACFEAWNALDQAEQQRILNGWRPQKVIPTVRGVVEELERTVGAEGAERVLFVDAFDSRIGIMPETILDRGLASPVRLTIREGTAKVDAVAMVTAALRQLEAHFDELIDLVDGSFRDYPMASGSPRAEKKPLTSISPAPKLGSKSGKKKTKTAV
jgi:hypothetical protein